MSEADVVFRTRWRGGDYQVQVKKSRTTIGELKQLFRIKIAQDLGKIRFMMMGLVYEFDATRLSDIKGLRNPQDIKILSDVVHPHTHSVSSRTVMRPVEADIVVSDNESGEFSPRWMDVLEEGDDDLVMPTRWSYDIRSDEDMLSGKVQKKLRLYSSAFLTSKHGLSEDVNQIVVHGSILKEIEEQRCDFPIIFRIRSESNGHVAHVSACSFTSEERCAGYVPYRILRQLGAPEEADVEGMAVELQTVSLPKAEYCRLQPLTRSWMFDVSSSQQEHVLESRLPRYQCLTLGETIEITYGGKSYELRVSELRPVSADGGVCIIDSDLGVDISEPEHEPDILRVFGPSGCDASPRNERILMDVCLKRDRVNFYELDLADCSAVHVEVSTTSGSPCVLYASSFIPYPTATEHTWSSEGALAALSSDDDSHVRTHVRRLKLSSADPKFVLGRPLRVGVLAKYQDTVYTIKFRRLDAVSTETIVGNAPALPQPSTDGETCTNCLRWIPRASLMLHQVHCASKRWCCPLCKLTMPIGDRDVHTSVVHHRIVCECGFEAEVPEMDLHREYECPQRLFLCPYCNVRISLCEQTSHEKACGGRTTNCPECLELVRHDALAYHIEHAHFNFNDN